jgi:TonB family protein
MCPSPMSSSKSEPLDAILSVRPDLIRLLEQKAESGLPPELALDLILHELVIRAVDATGATSAALALVRGGEMVCRAATGLGAPDLGIPLNTREGLSGACLRTRQPQLCADTEADPRVDSVIARRLGIRSILIVPVLDQGDLIGVLEVFSSAPSAFSLREQNLLEASAHECTRIRHAAGDLGRRAPALVPSDDEKSQAETELPAPPAFVDVPAAFPRKTQPLYESWTLILGTLAILATVAVSLLVGSRTGWLFPSRHSAQVHVTQVPPNGAKSDLPSTVPTGKPVSPARTAAATSAARSPAGPNSDELVVYDHGKVIFRMKPDIRATGEAPVRDLPSSAMTLPSSNVWLAPEQSESRLLSRIEPIYPADALAAHRSGDVVLRVVVAEDGSVASIRTLSGDPVLATAAADAVRQWRYQPYLLHDRPSQFQTDVTLKFSLPN